MQPIFNFSYRKVGGLRFVRLGRFGFTFWVSRTHPAARELPQYQWPMVAERHR